MTEVENIRALQQQVALYEDMKAYKMIFDLLFDKLHRFAKSFVKSNEAAEEIVSDAFLKIWEIRDKLVEIENLRQYLYIVTKNLSLNYLSRHHKVQKISLDALADNELVADYDPEQYCISSETMREVQAAISQLSPKCRLVLVMVKEHGLRYKEVAEILGLSVLTVRNQLAIATRKLSEALPAYSGKSIAKAV